MTPKEYAAQNALGFEGDTFLGATIQEIVTRRGINTIIETGTYLGNTTVKFAEMVPQVATIEASQQYFKEAFKKFDMIDNVHLIFGDSAKMLPHVITHYSGSNFLFFLDAHWNDSCPLLDELRIIKEAGIKPVIVIHDFQVPGRPDLGFDSYNGQDFTCDWIAESILAIYGENHELYFNDEATGAKRGVIFIEPK